MSFDIQNKVALVTGANRGIGKGIVEAFLAHGAKKVYLAVRDLESTNEFVAKYGEKVVPVFLDLQKPESISALAEQVKDVDVVVNNAGVATLTDVLNSDAEEAFKYELEINTFGLLRVAQAFISTLEKNQGAFVQLNSVASIKNFASLTTYSASKAATYSITQGLRETLSQKGIHVLSVHPGPIATKMAEDADMIEIAAPATDVAEGIVAALNAGDFHLFPDPMAKDFEKAYQGYAENVIEAAS